MLELKKSNSLIKYLQYEKALCKVVNNKARIKFLEDCRRANIIPKFLNFRIPNNDCFDNKSVYSFQKKLLHQEIVKAKGDRVELHKNVDVKRLLVKKQAPVYCRASIVWHYRRKKLETYKEVTSKHNSKLINLSKQQERPLFSVSNTVKVLVPELSPPKYVMETLSMGPKHPVMDRFDSKDVLVELDNLLKECERRFLPEDFTTNINVKTLNYIKHCDKMKSNRNITMTKKYLKENGLLAIPFDKGAGICLMTISMYQEKMNDILQLPQFTKVVSTRKNAKDPILKEEERIIDVLKTLGESGDLSKSLIEALKPTGSQPPRLYGLAKVHKTTVPMRPVLSMPGSPYYKIGKYLSKFLEKLTECNINCSTEEISGFIGGIHPEDTEEIISFDVSSLYTNVPVEESVQVCADLLYNKFSLPFSKDTFIELAMLVSSNVVMSTHDGYYLQTDGLAMGSPLAPYLANGWLSQYDDLIAMVPAYLPTTGLPDSDPELMTGNQSIEDPETEMDFTLVHAPSKMYFRYMDDILMIIDVRDLESKLEEINSLHTSLRFTVEREDNGELPFLDMLLKNEKGALSSSWYTKETDTSLMMNFHSLAPLRYKKSLVAGMVHRIYRACSSWESIDYGLQKARIMLEKNQYPHMFYDRIINKTLTNIISPQTKDSVEKPEEKPFLMFIKYRGNCSDEYARELIRICTKPDSAFQLPIRVIFTLTKAKSLLPPLKETVPNLLKSGVVYQISCSSCSACYVGQTIRHLKTRIGEHINNAGPVKVHLASCNATLSEDIKVLTSSPNTIKLMTLEALFIREIRPVINTKDEYRKRTLTIKFD